MRISKNAKRLFALMLALFMVFTLIPAQNVAATEDVAVKNEESVMEVEGLNSMTILADGEPVYLEKVEAAEALAIRQRATEFDESEPNNSTSTADVIYNNYDVFGSLSNSDPWDYFKFTLSSRCEVEIVGICVYNTLRMGVMNSSGSWTDYTYITWLGQTDGGYMAYFISDDYENNPYLSAGTYYIAVTDAHSSDKSNAYGFSFTHAGGSGGGSHTHSYGSWYTQTSATCSQPGVEARTCSCGAKETRETAINPNNHTMGIWVPDPNYLATCVTPGKEIRYCSGINADGVACGHYEHRDIGIDPDGHEIRELLPEAPGCSTPGLTAGEGCLLCGMVVTAQQTIPATGHYVEQGGTQLVDSYTTQNDASYPFAQESGWYVSTNHENDSTSTFEIQALYDCEIRVEYKVSSESSYDRLYVYINNYQHDVISGTVGPKSLNTELEPGDKIRFEYDKDVSVSEGDDCGYFRIVSCTQTEVDGTVHVSTDSLQPTCTESVVCDGCGEVVKPATGHDWDDGVEVNPELMEYTCNECGATYQEAIVGAYKAQIGSNKYRTVWDALMAARSGDVVEMIADSDERGKTLFMPSGVTLDLNTYDLYADGLIGLNGSILNAGRYSSSGDYGRLYVPMENLALTGGDAFINGNYDVIPVWNGSNAYVLANALINDNPANGYGLTIDQRAKTINFKFTHTIGGSANNAFFKDGPSDNATKFILRLEWESDNGVAFQDFVYKDSFVAAVSGGGYTYTFVLEHYDLLNINVNNLKVTAMILTDCGTITTGYTWGVNGYT